MTSVANKRTTSSETHWIEIKIKGDATFRPARLSRYWKNSHPKRNRYQGNANDDDKNKRQYQRLKLCVPPRSAFFEAVNRIESIPQAVDAGGCRPEGYKEADRQLSARAVLDDLIQGTLDKL